MKNTYCITNFKGPYLTKYNVNYIYYTKYNNYKNMNSFLKLEFKS